VLAVAIAIPFGGHVVKYSLSALATPLLEDKELSIDHAKFGAFQSAVSIPNLFVPFLGGLLLDLRDSRYGILLFLGLCTLGQLVFTLSIAAKSLSWALFARILFGLGQGSTVVAQSHVAATYFASHELVFAVALAESVHNVSGWVSKVYVVPIGRWSGSYMASLWMGVVFRLLSFFAGIVYFVVDPMNLQAAGGRKSRRCSLKAHDLKYYQQHSPKPEAHDSPMSVTSSAPSLTRSGLSRLAKYNQFTFGFCVLCALHLLFSNTYHLFDYVSVNFLESKYHTSTGVSAMYSSITHLSAIFLCPLAGYLLDHFGGKMYVCVAASLCTASAYLLFIFTDVHPAIPLLLLSLCVAFVPTILRSSVPDLISPSSVSEGCRVVLFATAYGVYEICESAGAVLGHVSVGWVVDQNEGDYTTDLWIFVCMSFTAFILCGALCVWDRYIRAEGAVINLSTKQKQLKLQRELQLEQEEFSNDYGDDHEIQRLEELHHNNHQKNYGTL